MKTIRKILLVEDNEGDVELIKEALNCSKTNCDIHVINNGEDAMSYLFSTEKNPDIILLDINLPKIDGKEILYTIKNNPALKAIPVIMLSTSSLQIDIDYSYNNHANCFIVKPGNLKEYIRILNSIESFWIECVSFPKLNTMK